MVHELHVYNQRAVQTEDRRCEIWYQHGLTGQNCFCHDQLVGVEGCELWRIVRLVKRKLFRVYTIVRVRVPDR